MVACGLFRCFSAPGPTVAGISPSNDGALYKSADSAAFCDVSAAVSTQFGKVRSPLSDSVKERDDQAAERRASGTLASTTGSSPSTPSYARPSVVRTPLQQEALWVGECLAAKDFAAVVLLRSTLLQDVVVGAQTRSSRQKRERVLRSLLQKSKSIAAATTHAYPAHLALPAPHTLLLRDAGLVQIKNQLLRVCATQRPGMEAFSEAEQLVADIKQWLQASPAAQSAATVLFVAGECIAQAEHLLRSAGLPRFWSPSASRLLLSLLHLYSALMDKVAHPAAARALARLLLRPALLALLADALDLVCFDGAFQAACAGGRQEWQGAALQLLEFHMRLLRYGAAHAMEVAPQVLGACLVRVWALLAPKGGLVVRLLEQPLGEETIAMQLQVLRFLRVLFDLPDSHQLLQVALADHYVQYHFLECVKYYQSSHASPKSVAAEMCGMHLATLRSLARHPGAAVRSRFNQLRVLDFFLREFALESELLAGEPPEVLISESLPDTSGDLTMLTRKPSASSKSITFASDAGGLSCSSFGSPRAVSAGRRRSAAAAAKEADGPSDASKFEYTYDLNEDFERMCAMEDELGCSIELDGFERSGMFSSRGGPASSRAGGAASSRGGPASSRAGGPASSRIGGGGGQSFTAGHSFRDGGCSSPSSPGPPTHHTRGLLALGSPRLGSPRSDSPLGVPLTLKPILIIPKLTLGLALRSSNLNSPSSGANTAVGPAAAAARAAALRDASTAAAAALVLAMKQDGPSSPGPGPRSGESLLGGSLLGAGGNSLLGGSVGPGSGGNVPSRMAPHAAARRADTSVSSISNFDSQAGHSNGSLRGGAGGGGAPSKILLDVGSCLDDGDEAYDHRPLFNSLQSMVSMGPGGRVMPSLLLGGGATLAALQEERESSGSGRSSGFSLSTALAAAGAAGGGGGPPVVDTGGVPRMVPTLNFSNLKKVADAGGSPLGASLSTAFNSLFRASHVPDSAIDYPQASPATTTTLDQSEAGTNGAPGGGDSQDEAGGTPTYAESTEHKLFYSDPLLHAHALHLCMALLLAPGGGLDPAYLTQFPLDNGLLNAEHILTWHLNGSRVVPVVQQVLEELEEGALAAGGGGAGSRCSGSGERGSGGGGSGEVARHERRPVERVMRLMSRQLFDVAEFNNLVFQTRGAYGGIYRAKMRRPGGGPSQQVVIKTIELPGSGYDRCVLPDVFGEVTILERYSGVNGFCQLIDYGLANDAYWLVMKRYRCSLFDWRARQKGGCGSPAKAVLYLNVLSQIVAVMQVLARDNVVHFDIKCSNVLIDPLPGTTDGELTKPTTLEPPFQVVLADFGEARAYHSAQEAYTARIRGTEVYKSPEMLMLNNTGQPLRGPGGLGGGRSGVGAASDVWSLGCVAYELLAGSVLFAGDYATVTHRVAFGAGPSLQLTAGERARLDDDAALVALVEFILVRDPAKRPGLDAVAERIEAARSRLMALLAADEERQEREAQAEEASGPLPAGEASQLPPGAEASTASVYLPLLPLGGGPAGEGETAAVAAGAAPVVAGVKAGRTEPSAAVVVAAAAGAVAGGQASRPGSASRPASARKALIGSQSTAAVVA